MRDGGTIAAASDVLHDVLERRTPVKEAVRDWGKRHRFAGSRDRAWISGLVLDALRKKDAETEARRIAITPASFGIMPRQARMPPQIIATTRTR